MTMQHLVVLALVQGITEFLPISSQAHLILIPALTGWPDQTLIVDVALHVGTLGAVMLYLWRDLWSLTRAVLRPSRWNREPEARLVIWAADRFGTPARDRINELLSMHTGQPLEKIQKDTDRDFFMSAQEAKDYGLIDEVVIGKKK